MKKEVEGMFEGPMLGLIIRMSAPILAGMVFHLVYNITDMVWISRIDIKDPSYVGGVGIIFPILFLAMALANGIQIGVSSLVARSIGAKDTAILNKTAESGMVLSGFLAVFMMVFFYAFGGRIVAFLGADSDYYRHAMEYLYFIIPAGSVFFFSCVFNGILQGEGLMKYVMKAMIIGTVFNLVLDPVFIFVLDLKVRGAAMATLISHFLSFIYILSVFLGKEKSSIQIEWKRSNISLEAMKEITVIGLPQASSMLLMSLSFLILNKIIISIDPLALTAHSLCGRVDQMTMLPIFAVASSLVTIVGQNYGRGNYERVKLAWKTAVLTTGSVILCLATIIVFAAPFIFRFLSDVEGVVDYAVRQTRIIEYTYVFATIGILGRSFFQGIGKPIPALILTALRVMVLGIPLGCFFVYVLDMKMPGVWLGFVIASFVTTIVGVSWVLYTLRKLKAISCKR